MPHHLPAVAAPTGRNPRELAGTPDAAISLFSSAWATTPAAGAYSIRRFVEDVRDGRYAGVVGKVREVAATGDKRELSAAKRGVPAVTLSVLMVTRAKDAPKRIECHSGWIQCDFDAADNVWDSPESARDAIAGDPHVGAAFLSLSGLGVKAIVRIDWTAHGESFAAACDYFRRKYGMEMDAKTADEGRLCYVSHDPAARMNEDAAPLAVAPALRPDSPELAERSTRPPVADFGEVSGEWTPEDVAELLEWIPTRPDHDEWKVICAGVFSAIGEDAGCAVLNAWSPEEKPGEYRKVARTGLDKPGVGALVNIAKGNGYPASSKARDRWERMNGKLRDIVIIGGAGGRAVKASPAAGAPATPDQAESFPNPPPPPPVPSSAAGIREMAALVSGGHVTVARAARKWFGGRWGTGGGEGEESNGAECADGAGWVQCPEGQIAIRVSRRLRTSVQAARMALRTMV